jgi:hypothetical protein
MSPEDLEIDEFYTYDNNVFMYTGETFVKDYKVTYLTFKLVLSANNYVDSWIDENKNMFCLKRGEIIKSIQKLNTI